MDNLGIRAQQGRALAGRALARRLAPRWEWNDADLLRLQEHRARRILSAASERPGYVHLEIDAAATDDPLTFLDSAPTLTKDQLRGREEQFWRGRGTVAAATSGTTGTPLRLRRSIISVLEEQAWVSNWRSWAGFGPGQRYAELRGTLIDSPEGDIPHAWTQELGRLTLSSYHLAAETVHRYATLLRKYRIEWIMAYPSSMTALLVLAEQQGVALPPIRGVFTSSENLSAENRTYIEQRLGSLVWDHYGNAERTVAASQCEHGRYHLLPGYALVSPDGAQLVTTGLTNTAMPLLRYVVTDEVFGWSEEVCPCGRRGPTLEGIYGRSESFLIGERGRLIGRMDHVFKGLPGVVAGQLHQHREGHLTVRVVPSGELPTDDLVDLLVKRTTSRMGIIEVDVEVVELLTPQTNGKVPFVIQDLPLPGDNA